MTSEGEYEEMGGNLLVLTTITALERLQVLREHDEALLLQPSAPAERFSNQRNNNTVLKRREMKWV